MIFFRRSPEYDPDEEINPTMRFHLWTSGWRGALVIFLLVTLVIGGWKGRDAYGWLKERRVEWLIAQSEEARARGDNAAVKDKLKQALLLLRRHPSTLRAVARYQIEMRDLSALNTYTELLKTGQATIEDKVTFAREASRLGRPDLAADVFAELKENPDTKDTATVLAIGAGQAASEGRWPEALQLARRASASPGEDEARAYAQSILARLLLQSATDQPEGIALLSSLALRPDAIGLEALEMLGGLAQNPQAAPLFFNGKLEVNPLMDAAERHPQATAALKVGMWSLRLAAEPANRAAITQELFQRYKDDPSPALRLEAARWLNRNKMLQLALDLAEPSKLESQDWFLLSLDGVAAQGNWEEVFRTLSNKDEKVPLSPALRQLFEMRAAIETGRRPDVATAWREIEIAARTDTAESQLYIAGYAERTGFPVQASRLYRVLLDRKDRAEDILPAADKLNRPRRLACYTGLLRTGGGAMTLEDLRGYLTAFAEEFPEIDEVQNDSAYLQLLAGKDLAQAGSTARRLVQKKPELLAYRTTAALAVLRQQEAAGGGGLERSPAPGAAAALYDGWTIDWSTAQDRYKAVYAAALRAAGRAQEAETIAAQIKPEGLRPEERKLAGLR